jgi:copper chaperone CopZ
MYGSTIGINLFLFMIVFPLLTNVSLASPTITGYSIIPGTNNLSLIKLKVDIPCSGHASLISQELKSIDGVIEVKFSFPNVFDVKYDPVRTSKQQILSLKVFDTYKATVLNESDILIESSNLQKTQESNDQQIKGSCCGGSGCSGTCGCGAK